jgi:hypothetical protein
MANDKHHPIVVAPFVRAVAGHADRHTPGTLEFLSGRTLLIPGEPIPFTQAQTLIIEALTDFHPGMAAQAQNIFDTPACWEVTSVPPGECRLAECVTPARTGIRRPRIRYEYDGTIDGAVYLAHELGHAIAYDSGHAAPEHVAEVQAYFTQSIVWDYLDRLNIPGLSAAARTHRTADLSRAALHIPIALAAQGILKGEKGADILRALIGSEWEAYGPAQALAAGRVDPESEVAYLHIHPMGAMAGQVLFRRAREVGPEKRDALVKSLFGQVPIHSLDSLLSADGDTDLLTEQALQPDI